MASLVPALAGHVELQLEGRLLATLAGLEVPAGPTGTLEGLDLAHEDAVHEGARRVGRVGQVGGEAVVLLAAGTTTGEATRATRVVEALLVAETDEATVAGEQVGREELPHAVASWRA